MFPLQRHRRPECPDWCTTRHGELAGEDDAVHVGAEMVVRRTTLRLCATTDPVTGVPDGPYVLVDDQQFDVHQTAQLVAVLMDLLVEAHAPFSLRAEA